MHACTRSDATRPGVAHRFFSTRGRSPSVSLGQAIVAGQAPDGGLYVPQALPRLGADDFADHRHPADVARRMLGPFLAGHSLSEALPALCDEAFATAMPMRPLASIDGQVLELFHGPTAAFKDFGARFLSACLQRLRAPSDPPLTIVVATTGDTGAAVAAAFHGVPGTRVVVLYPDGRVSPRQAHQLGAFGDNVRTLRVKGSFDDCQRLARRALADTELQARVPMSSANSISLGRLLPQMAWYAHASLSWWRRHGTVLGFVVPAGNLGNAVACAWARACGLPVGRIHLASNANDAVPAYLAGDDYAPRSPVHTLANAMDVGDPSNLERLRWTFGDDDSLRAAISGGSAGDEAIRDVIRRHAAAGELLCPHTAAAVHQLECLRRSGDAGPWAVVATAHPAKFESVMEPLTGRRVDVPPALQALLDRPSHAEPMPADYGALRKVLLGD